MGITSIIEKMYTPPINPDTDNFKLVPSNILTKPFDNGLGDIGTRVQFNMLNGEINIEMTIVIG